MKYFYPFYMGKSWTILRQFLIAGHLGLRARPPNIDLGKLQKKITNLNSSATPGDEFP
jgi:hypothetical protein